MGHGPVKVIWGELSCTTQLPAPVIEYEYVVAASSYGREMAYYAARHVSQVYCCRVSSCTAVYSSVRQSQMSSELVGAVVYVVRMVVVARCSAKLYREV